VSTVPTAGHPAAALATCVQRRLEASYRLPPGPDVREHLSADAGFRAACTGPGHEGIDEELLLLEDEGELFLALYLDEVVLEALAEHDPRRGLHSGNLQAFLHLIEGVSHFRYAVDRAAHDRTVKLLELELQAEIDKYVLLVQWLIAQRQRPRGPGVRRLLYEGNGYRHDEASKEGERYRVATRYAAAWCTRLGRLLPGWRELQRLWRLPLEGKLHHIGV
jgi:hypothetical protein